MSEKNVIAGHRELAENHGLATIDQLPNELRNDSTSLTEATIMMVDDESTTMEVMQAFLEEAGYQRFVLLEKSTQAMQTIETCRPDLLLLDLMMPDVSGFEILQRVRAHALFTHLPVIILTSSSDAATKLRALDLGATDFLAKPVDSSELTLRVRNTLAARAYQNQLAYYDGLTKLPNRSLFLDRLTWFLQRAENQNENLVMLHITLPQFKRVYHTFGPQIGDQVILQIAERIQACVRGSDIIGRGIHKEQELTCLFRVSADEFSIVCPSIAQPENAIKIASRIIGIMEFPFEANGTEVSISPRIGIASYPNDARDVSTLVQCAVGASAQADEEETKAYKFYSSDMNTQSYERLQLEADLRHAIEGEHLVLHYQPQLDVKNGQIQGVEAVVRVKNPDGTLMFPDGFISLAEETSMIVPLGEWVFKEACAQLARWQAQGIWIQVSVNVSAKQFHAENLVKFINDTLKNYEVDTRCLTIELTESLIMQHAEQSVEILQQLIGLGVKLSIDDFGTGYSSLSYLKKLPLHELKIDRSFLKDMVNNAEDKALVSAMIYLAHEFKLKVVAEGVENQEQLDLLANLACDEYQGYFFCQPISAPNLTSMLPKLTANLNT